MATSPEQNNKNLWITFGQKVRERREEINITQDVAAKRAGMVRQRWIQIEQGDPTRRSTVEKIATVLELEPGIVLKWAGFQAAETSSATQATISSRIESTTKTPTPKAISAQGETLLDFFEKLPEPKRLEVLRYVLDLYQDEINPKPKRDPNRVPIIQEHELTPREREQADKLDEMERQRLAKRKERA
jgi:transcriptional regulator with XRE-family HTH domain